MSRKPSPGVCGRCGCAVVQVPEAPYEGMANGHTYYKGRLIRVRCIAHDEAYQVFQSDAIGGQI